MENKRTGLTHDFTKKKGVLHSQLILPGGRTEDRSDFWNRVEDHHKRGDAVVAREFEVSLPRELTPDQRQQLAILYASQLCMRYGVAADVSLHEPGTVTDRDLEKKPDQYWEIDPETGRRHNGNWHAHILMTACAVGLDGTLGKKVVELDPIHCQRDGIANVVEVERGRWADLQNAALKTFGHDARVDHRSLVEQGIFDREPQQHLGPAAHGFERRTGETSKKRKRMESATARLLTAKQLGELERAEDETDATIIDLTTSLDEALKARDNQHKKEKKEMPSYFPEGQPGEFASLWPDTKDEPSPLLLLQQQYEEQHKARQANKAKPGQQAGHSRPDEGPQAPRQDDYGNGR